MQNQAKRSKLHLRSKRWIELLVKQIVMKVFDGDQRPRRLPDVVAVAELSDLLEDPLRLLGGDVAVALQLGEEPPQLGGAHLGPAVGVGGEGGLDVGRRLGLVPPELAGEADAVLVAPHFLFSRRSPSSFLLFANYRQFSSAEFL